LTVGCGPKCDEEKEDEIDGECVAKDNETAPPAGGGENETGDEPADDGERDNPTDGETDSGTTADTTPPANVEGFNISAGSTLGSVSISVNFPDDISEYASAKIFTQVGDTAPDCGDGVLVKSFSSFTDTTFNDYLASKAGQSNSYRICIEDAAGNATSSVVESIKGTHEQLIFITSDQYNAKLSTDFNSKSFESGLYGADERCNYHATDPSYGNMNGRYKAVISDSSFAAKDRLITLGNVVNTNDDTVITGDAAGLWDLGTTALAAEIYYDEFGNAQTGGFDPWVWTGTDSDGSSLSGSCTNWTSDDGNGQGGGYGDTSQTGTAAIGGTNFGCGSTDLRLLCIEQLNVTSTSLNASTGSIADGDIDISIDFPSDTTMYSKAELRRSNSIVPPKPTCDDSNDTIVKTYTNFDDESLTDGTGSLGLYSYRLCVFDRYNVAIDSTIAKGVKAKGNFHNMFVTSADWDTDLTIDYYNLSTGGFANGTLGGDHRCQFEADHSGLEGQTWKAVLSTSTADAIDQIPSSGAILNINNDLIETERAQLFVFDSGYLLNSIGYDSYGNSLASYDTYMSGTSATDGSQSANHCTNYTSGGGNGDVGQPTTTGSGWLQGGTSSCGSRQRLLCVSQ
jgi:hypothetical protein